MYSSIAKVLTVVAFSALVSSCGKQPNIVKDIKVVSTNHDSDIHLSLQADLDLGSMQFPSAVIPILHPDSRVQLGSVELQPVLGGNNQLRVSANISALTDLRTEMADLPNGNLVPLIAQNPTITIELGSGAELYLTLGSNAVALGVAIPIRQFDSIGSNVGSANLFPVFTIDQVIGSAGLFTGSKAGQNGFALVADVTNYVNMQDVFVPQFASELIAAKSMRSFVAPVQAELEEIQLDYRAQKPASRKEDQINKMIYNLNQKRTKLKLH